MLELCYYLQLQGLASDLPNYCLLFVLCACVCVRACMRVCACVFKNNCVETIELKPDLISNVLPVFCNHVWSVPYVCSCRVPVHVVMLRLNQTYHMRIMSGGLCAVNVNSFDQM